MTCSTDAQKPGLLGKGLMNQSVSAVGIVMKRFVLAVRVEMISSVYAVGVVMNRSVES